MPGCSIDVDGSDFYFAECFVPLTFFQSKLTQSKPTSSNTLTHSSSSPAYLSIPSSAQPIIQAMNKAIDKAKDKLLANQLELFFVSGCLCYQPEAWRGVNALTQELKANAEKAMNSGEVVLGEFRSEEIQALVNFQYSLADR